MMRYSANWPRFPLTRPQLSGGVKGWGKSRPTSGCPSVGDYTAPSFHHRRGEQASSHLAARKARDGQGYADSRFATKAILTGTRIKASTYTVSNVREEAEMLLIGSRHRRMQPIKPEEGYAMKTNTVCLASLSAPAAPYMGRRSSPRGLERLQLLFSLLGSLFCTDRGSDE
jgi:hypothetical protein